MQKSVGWYLALSTSNWCVNVVVLKVDYRLDGKQLFIAEPYKRHCMLRIPPQWLLGTNQTLKIVCFRQLLGFCPLETFELEVLLNDSVHRCSRNTCLRCNLADSSVS